MYFSLPLKAVLTVFAISASVVYADVIIDEMTGGISNKMSGTQGGVFTLVNGKINPETKKINTDESVRSDLLYPLLIDEEGNDQKFYYFDSDKDGKSDVARIDGILGGIDTFPFLGYGAYLTGVNMATTTFHDLSQSVTHFAFQARGIGNWRLKFYNKITDSIPPFLPTPKEPDQVAWNHPLYNIDSVDFKWYVLPAADFRANVGEYMTAINAAGITALDHMKSVYKIAWQTDGYDSTAEGTRLWIEVDNFILVGNITSLGSAFVPPTAEQSAAIQASLPVFNPVRKASSLSSIFGNSENAGVFLLNGKRAGIYSQLKNINRLPHTYVIKFENGMQKKSLDLQLDLK